MRRFTTIFGQLQDFARRDRCQSRAENIGLALLTESRAGMSFGGLERTKRDTTKDTCIHQCLRSTVERTPETVAVVFEDKQRTYREINTGNQWRPITLKKLGVGPRQW